MEPFCLIDNDNLRELNAALQEEFPRSFYVQNWIITKIKWHKLDSKNEFFVLSLGGNIKDGIVAFGKTEDKVYYLTIFTFKDDLREMEQALLNTRAIPWEQNMVCGIPPDSQAWFTRILKTLGYEVQVDTPTDYYRLPREVAINFQVSCPEDVFIATIKQEDIPKINSLWQHKFDRSDELLSKCVMFNFGIGVYSVTSREILSWAIKFEYSDVAIVQTEKEHRRKGYALIVMKEICKRIALEGEDILAFVVPGNTASENLMKGIGFEYAGTCNWIEYEEMRKI